MNPLSGNQGMPLMGLAVAVLVVMLLGLAIFLARQPGPARPPGARRASATPKAVPSARRLPQQWPLNPRPIANSGERRAWQWLRETFPEHSVVPKLPLTRFTAPRNPGESSQWFELLSSAYCSFTICNAHAHVVGCVDVLGPRGLSRGNRQLKQTLLTQCGIGYWVMSADSLPSAEAIRGEFLGVADPDSVPPTGRTAQADLETVRHQLHEALDRNRVQRQLRTAPGGLDSDLTPWPQPDSFLGGLDSQRHALTHR